MLDMLYNWQFWVILAVILIIIAWVCTSYRLVKKDPSLLSLQSPKDAIVSLETISSLNSSLTESCDNDLTPSLPNFINKVDSSADDSDLFQSEFTPELPQHIAEPDYYPPSTRKPSPPRSAGEIACKAAVEKIYGVPFHSVWPDWLRNPKTGRCLELDLYNDELKLAIEYHGEQHYKYTPRFHKSYNDFVKAIERDNVKLDICDKHGVYVITVPYNCPHNQIESYIRYYDPQAVMLRANRLK